MRVRTAKQRAQRIDLNYFKHAHGLKRWRILLSLALPVAALLWVTVYAAAGSRTPYSAGAVSSAHAFAEPKCEVCHTGGAATRGGTASGAPAMFRAHTTDAACLTCHDAPAHAVNETTPPACATCHQEHKGRVQLVKTDDRFCRDCHGNLETTHGEPRITKSVERFPDGHPEFAAAAPGAKDPGHLTFNHAVHLKEIRGPNGPETLACASCHKPELRRTASKRPLSTGVMAPVNYQQQCARCHPLFFDERIDQPVPHETPDHVRAFVQQALTGYIREHPDDISKPEAAFRRVPLNFPRPAAPAARTAQEWVTRRIATDERILWNKTCSECHQPETGTLTINSAVKTVSVPVSGSATKTVSVPVSGLPVYAPTRIPTQWMPRAAFDHSPHVMVTCQSCHAAEGSMSATDVLVPPRAVCATCHAPDKGAESRCFECHRYHDWSKTHAVTPAYSVTDFK